MESDWLDEHAKRIQDSIEGSDKEIARNKLNSPEEIEAYEEFAAGMMAWEKAFDTAPVISVREYIGDPEILYPDELSDAQILAELKRIWEILMGHQIAADFHGDWSDREMYICIYEQLLDEEIQDNPYPGMISHYTYSTPQSEVEMWLNDFILSVFHADYDDPPITLSEDEWYDADGNPSTKEVMLEKIHEFWAVAPPKKSFQYEIVACEATTEEGRVTVELFWSRADGVRKYIANFRFKPSKYEGWDVIQTNLLDQLLAE